MSLQSQPSIEGFLEISFDEQTRLLERMQTADLSKTDWPEVFAKDFFRMVRDHTLQGACSHPKYGRNRNNAAWNMIGYYDCNCLAGLESLTYKEECCSSAKQLPTIFGWNGMKVPETSPGPKHPGS